MWKILCFESPQASCIVLPDSSDTFIGRRSIVCSFCSYNIQYEKIGMQLLFSGNFAGIFKYEVYPDVIVDLKSVSSLWDQKVSVW